MPDKIRTGARTFLNLLAKACKMSHIPGFRAGVRAILGDTNGEAVFTLWDPLCSFVETLIAADNYFNQIDFEPDTSGDEDITEGV